jgi:hypothetical protein
MLTEDSKCTAGEYFVGWKKIELNQSINRIQGGVLL